MPGFDFPSGYTAFQFVFVFLQAAAFGGVFTGFAIAADFETGFARRMLLGRAAPRGHRCSGYVLAGDRPLAVTGAVVTVAALLAGHAGRRQRASSWSASSRSGCCVNMTATLWGAGLAFRFQVAAGRPADADPGVPHPVPRAGLRAA